MSRALAALALSVVTAAAAALGAPQARPGVPASGAGLDGAAAPAQAAAGPVREVLDGGLELVVVAMPGARTASLRYVVRAGSAHDPPGREGLAHLLEHLLGQGRGVPLIAEARRQGAYLNAFTSRDSTIYVLDAPAAAFPGLAEQLLRSVTDPRLAPAEIAREQAVVGREDLYRDRGPGLRSLLEDALFPAHDGEVGPIGTAAARTFITREDLVRFYQDAYSTRNTTVVVAGAVEVDAARALVERGVMLPPGLPEERLPLRDAKPALPATSKLHVGFLAAVLGYAIAPGDEPACAPLAELLELRLLEELRLREPLVRDVSVQCLAVRGTSFLLATAHGQSIEATDLPERMDAVLAQAAARPVGGGERALVEQRLARRAERAAADPGVRADRLAEQAARPRAAAAAELARPAAKISTVEIQAVARRAFRPQRRALVFLSPFEGKGIEDEEE